MKPTTPMHGGQHSHLKPTTPMHGSNHPKQAHTRPQRRWRFQLAHLTGPQRRHRFHGQPANATGDTTTKPHTDLHETHNTNARRPTLTFETHNTNARLQPPKTGPYTPAKAMAVSTGPPHRPAKATPVSRPTRERNRWHHHKALDSRHRDLSTGVILNASYPQGHNSSFSSHSHRAIIHQSGPYPQLQMVVSNCYLNSSHPSDRRFAL